MVDITLLGTSALLPLPDRFLSSAFLTCNGRSILFDCGEGTQISARKYGANINSIDLIALTHYHGDHIFGLPGLLQTLHTMGRTAPIYITGPKNSKENIGPLLNLAGPTSYEVNIIDNNELIKLNNINKLWPEKAVLSSFVTEHRVPSIGYSFTLGRAGKFNPDLAKALNIPVNLWNELQKGNTVKANGVSISPDNVLGPERNGIKVIFTGDTAYCESIVKFSQSADLIISDATYSDNLELAVSRGHMNFSHAARVAKESCAKELWLTHFSQTITEPSLELNIATDIFNNSIIGFDGMKKTINFIDE